MDMIFFVYLGIHLVSEFRKEMVMGSTVKHSDECKELIENFAAASAQFTFCTLQNARPVHICCSCVNEYYKVEEEHSKISQHNKNSSCDEKLINQDRLEVIENNFSYIKNLWSRGQCKNCFENQSTLSNTTKEFIKLYSNMSSCFESKYDPVNKAYSPEICFLCADLYYKMSKFYANLKETSGNGNVCIDIVDSVNITQHLWSNVLHCGETIMTFEIPLIVISSCFCLLPILFYLCAWKFTKDRSSDVINQNRVTQRFRQRWRSRTAILSSG